MRVVLDCNVLVSAARVDGTCREALTFVIIEIERLAVVVEPADVLFGLRDPDDEVYLATAVAGGATLITGNTRDFTEARYGPVEVWSPRAFLDRAS